MAAVNVARRGNSASQYIKCSRMAQTVQPIIHHEGMKLENNVKLTAAKADTMVTITVQQG